MSNLHVAIPFYITFLEDYVSSHSLALSIVS